MYVVIKVPDGEPETVSSMVGFVATELEKGMTSGLISPEFNWSIEEEEEK